MKSAVWLQTHRRIGRSARVCSPGMRFETARQAALKRCAGGLFYDED
jgi:hypothetical protein